MNEQSSFIGIYPDEWSRAYLIQFQQNFPDGEIADAPKREDGRK